MLIIYMLAAFLTACIIYRVFYNDSIGWKECVAGIPIAFVLSIVWPIFVFCWIKELFIEHR